MVSRDRRAHAIACYLKEVPPSRWSIGDLAQCARVSQSHLRRLFVELYGVSPKRHLRVRRVAIAEVLLSNSCLSVKEIATQVGVGDISHFTRDFIAYYGCPPGQYSRNATELVAHGPSVSLSFESRSETAKKKANRPLVDTTLRAYKRD